ncbi:MAG TPA: molybdopterin-dependent oxidoreductase, partial [Nitrospiraceae bacterium]|nr:molybdopterin-dependent oxidoreductase [Nitrospiraceae bacterium]
VKECPTGALTEKMVLEWGVPTQTVRTTCAYCGVGCAFDAGVRDGRVVTMTPADDGPSNQGHACMKGRFGWTYHDAPDRLRTPLLRRGNDWEEISWESALDRVAQEFTRIKNTSGPDALATISSSRGTNEENYLFAKFMRCVIGTNHIDNCARVCHSATVTGMMETLGASAATNSIQDLDRAHLIMVVGANPTESHPVVGARIKQAHRRGVPLIVIDPRRTELARLADLHLQLRPGTNVALFNAMGHVLVKEGLLDQTFIATRTEGVDDWLKTVAGCTPEAAEAITGVPAHLIYQAARRYGSSGASFCCHGLGVTEHRWGSHGVIALCNLALATGNIGKPGAGINPLRGQNNVQGASDMGCLPTYFAGYQSLDDPARSISQRDRQVCTRNIARRIVSRKGRHIYQSGTSYSADQKSNGAASRDTPGLARGLRSLKPDGLFHGLSASLGDHGRDCEAHADVCWCVLRSARPTCWVTMAGADCRARRHIVDASGDISKGEGALCRRRLSATGRSCEQGISVRTDHGPHSSTLQLRGSNTPYRHSRVG